MTPNDPPTKVTLCEEATCKGCPWIVRGAEQTTKNVFDWGCRFYHKNLGFYKPYPPRLSICDIDGRLSTAKYNQKKQQNNTESEKTTEETP